MIFVNIGWGFVDENLLTYEDLMFLFTAIPSVYNFCIVFTVYLLSIYCSSSADDIFHPRFTQKIHPHHTKASPPPERSASQRDLTRKIPPGRFPLEEPPPHLEDCLKENCRPENSFLLSIWVLNLNVKIYSSERCEGSIFWMYTKVDSVLGPTRYGTARFTQRSRSSEANIFLIEAPNLCGQFTPKQNRPWKLHPDLRKSFIP